jgi:phosphoglycolate phosphatase-like HAD superfamily hydrolase
MDAIFFDLDGTLTDPKIGICGIWRQRSGPSGPGPFPIATSNLKAPLTFPKELI